MNANTTLPWWAWMIPLWPTMLAMVFTVLTGWLRGRATGQYPTVHEWSQALLALLQPIRATPQPEQTERPAALPRQAAPDDEVPNAEQQPRANRTVTN